ncbi:hypothetical protein TWF730_005027 [Orbilia blumenaviensis]|uniref:Uncharacterized protein n=1 Tax=Orbilia blumenaviensis TaxID=1796055 RepID=A0AAV9VKD0_9PEZI
MSMERFYPPTPEMLKAHEGQVFWGGVFIDPRKYSSSSSDNSIPYNCPRSQYGYFTNSQLPKHGSVAPKPIKVTPPAPVARPEVGFKTFQEYVQARGHDCPSYIPYNGAAKAVQFPSMQSMGYEKQASRSFWSSLCGCFCGGY